MTTCFMFVLTFVYKHVHPPRYQMGGGWGKSNAVVKTMSSAYYPCYRRPNIINDDQEHEGHYCTTKA